MTLQLTERYNRMMRVLADAAGVKGSSGLAAKQFVRQQAGLLVKTLVTVTPPKDRKETANSISFKVRDRFALLDEDYHGHAYTGYGVMDWYFWDKKFLFGVAPEKNMANASVDELYKLYFQITKGGRLKLDFKFPRKQQKVLIWQKIVTKRKTAAELIKRLIRHIGRLKAGWLPAWDTIKPNGAEPPQFITRHRQGARGAVIDGLGMPGQPHFVLINRALGIKKAESFLRVALAIRMKAMAGDAKLYIKGIKEKLA